MGIRKLVPANKVKTPKMVGKKQRRSQMLSFTIELFGKDIIERLKSKNIDLIQAQAEIQLAYARWVESQIAEKIDARYGKQNKYDELVETMVQNCDIRVDVNYVDTYGNINPLNVLRDRKSKEIICTWNEKIDFISHVTKKEVALN